MTGRNLRTALLALATAALATVASGSGQSIESFVAVSDAAAQSVAGTTELRVGDRLVALFDVELDAAVIRAGSSVSVVARKKHAGDVVFDVALADGHVVKGVPQIRLRNAFRAG